MARARSLVHKQPQRRPFNEQHLTANACDLGIEQLYSLMCKDSPADDALLLRIVRERPGALSSKVFRRTVLQRRHLCGPLIDIVAQQADGPALAARILYGTIDAPREHFERLLSLTGALTNTGVSEWLLFNLCRRAVLYKLSAVLAAGLRPTARCFAEFMKESPIDVQSARARLLFEHDHVYPADERLAIALVAVQRLGRADLEFIFGRIGLDLPSLSIDERVQVANRMLRNWYHDSASMLSNDLLAGVPLDRLDMTFHQGKGYESVLARVYLAGADQRLVLGAPSEIW